MADCILDLYRSAVDVGKQWGPDFAAVPTPGLAVIPGEDPFLSAASAARVFGLAIDRDHNAAVNLARLGDALRTGGTGTGTGSSPAASHRAGDGRGATRETEATPVADAASDETSTPHRQQPGKTGTAPPQGEAA